MALHGVAPPTLVRSVNEMTFLNGLIWMPSVRAAIEQYGGHRRTGDEFTAPPARMRATPRCSSKQAATWAARAIHCGRLAGLDPANGRVQPFNHRTDIAPTVLAAIEPTEPTHVDGFEQEPMEEPFRADLRRR